MKIMEVQSVKVPALGIDLGTTYSCVAVWQRGKIEVIPNEQGNKTTPSFVAFTQTERLIGDAAKSQASINPSNTIFGVKRLMGRKLTDESVQKDIKLWPFKVDSGRRGDDANRPMIQVSFRGRKKEYAAEEISSMILSKMKEVAEANIGSKVKNAVITVPAYFNNMQRQATLDAGMLSGLNVMRIINEPTAAAIAYGLDRAGSDGKNVLIFDLGGGTIDVSLVSIKNDVFEVKAVSGNTHLGGEDFDNRMVEYCVDEFKRKHRKDIRGNSKAIGRLRRACERAKRELSFAHKAVVDLDCLADGIDFSAIITRSRFEILNKDLFENCLKPVERCIIDAHMEINEIQEVVLVGGSTRIPKIQELLQEFFAGRRLCKSINPDEAVAYGAAAHAAILNCLKDETFALVDVTPFSLGIENNTGNMSILIPRNTPIPTKKHRLFTTTKDGQTEVTISVYEGEKAIAHENNLLGKFDLSGICPAPQGTPNINVWFEIDANGIMKCHAEEQDKGNSNGITFRYRSESLSREEIDKMMSEAAKLKADDEKQKLKIRAMINLEKYAERIQGLLKCKQIGQQDSRKKMQDAIDNTLKWLDWNFLLTEISRYESKLEELKNICEPIVEKIHVPCDCVPY